MEIFIDADSLIYQAASRYSAGMKEASAIEGDDLGLEEVANTSMTKYFDDLVANIEKATGMEANLVISVKPRLECCKGMADNFRYAVMEDVAPGVKGYKHNRAGMPVPDSLDEMYEYVFSKAVCIPGIEADDYCVFMGRQGYNIAAIDKDVIQSLPKAYNYKKKEWVTNSIKSIAKWPYFQTLAGDSADGLRGVVGIGPKKAEKKLEGLTTDKEMWLAVVQTYFYADQTIAEAIGTMQCVRMDQWTPEDGLILWTPPL